MRFITIFSKLNGKLILVGGSKIDRGHIGVAKVVAKMGSGEF